MVKHLLLVMFIFFATAALSQNSISGRVIDTTEKKQLANAVVLVMQEKDSMLVTYTRTSEKGVFHIEGLLNGNYILLISLHSYTDYTYTFTLPTERDIDLGNIPLMTIAHLLQEVIVTQNIPRIRIKGDTTEYKADRFKVEANATVEDLLKVLPGITVDSKGNITANGKRVAEVLVDGEPFFSDDPVLVTRNLRSSMVNQVQVYDKKNDRDAFSGVSTSTPKTVVNLKLKETEKKGYFGNVLFGIGTQRYHNSEVMYNKFKGKEKISFFAIVTNTSGAGLSSLNVEKFSDNSAFAVVREMVDPFDSWGGNYTGEGLPLLQSAGLHYNNKWNGDTQSINANYKRAHLTVEGTNTLNTIQALRNGRTLETKNIQNYHNNRVINRLNGSYQYKLDSTSTLKLILDGHTSEKKIQSSFESEALEDGNTLLNTQSRNIAFTNSNNTFVGDILWLKKMKKKRRTLTASVSVENNKIKSSGQLFALNRLFSSGSPIADTTDQYKLNNSAEYNISTSVSYTEPISPSAILNIQAGQAFYSGNSSISSFNKSTNASYTILDSANSSYFSLTTPRQKLTAQYVLTKKKFQLAIGNELNRDIYKQIDKKHSLKSNRDFVYHNPLVSFTYSPSAQSSLALRYAASTKVPSFQQLQPFILNLNPTTKFIGNPTLIPSYVHTFYIGYLKFKMLRNQAFSYNIRISKLNNAISLSSTIDSFGRTLYKWVNINGNYSGSGDVNFSTKLPKLDLFISTRGGVQLERSGGIINGQPYFANTENYTTGLSIRKSKEKKYSISLGSSFSFTKVKYSLPTIFSNSFTTIQSNFSLDLYPHKKVQFHIDGNLLTRQQVKGFEPLSPVFFLTSWTGIKFLKKETLLFKTTLNNILNTNALNMRYLGPEYSSQTNYNVIGRYLFFSLAWNFVSNSSQQKPK